MATHQVATSFPDTSYSTSNKPSSTTLKSDIQILEDGHNAHDSDTDIHVSDLSAVVTLTGSQTLTNKTLTSPVLNTGLSGTAFLDEDAMTSNSATKVASQQSIKAYVDAAILAVKTALFPIGSYYANGAVSTNPATLLGFGTWTAIAGKVIVGLDGTQTEFDALLETGGEKTHALTETELAQHDHPPIGTKILGSGSGGTGANITTGGGGFAEFDNTGNAGSGTAHNNLQPYEVAALWRRTA